MYISSAAFTAIMRTSILQSQSDLADAQKEVGSGTYADLGVQLGTGSGGLLALSHQKEQLGAYAASAGIATSRLTAANAALTALQSTASSFQQSLTQASSAGNAAGGLQATASASLQSLIAGLNTTVGGQAVFGGIATDTPPVADYKAGSPAKQAIDQAFQARFGTAANQPAASSISASDMADFLGNQFAALFDASAFKGTWSGATDAVQTTEVAPGETVSSSLSANADPFRAMARAFAMVTEFTGSATKLAAGAQQAVVAAALTSVSGALGGLTDLQASVGSAQNAVSSAGTRVSAQSDVLTSQISAVHDVDVTGLSTRISALQTQLQASYEVTSALKKLSLVNYFSA